MNKAIHLPLGIHFILSSQSEFIHTFMFTTNGMSQWHGCQSATIDRDITKYRLSTMDGVNVDNAGAIIDQLPLIFYCTAVVQWDCLFLPSFGHCDWHFVPGSLRTGLVDRLIWAAFAYIAFAVDKTGSLLNNPWIGCSFYLGWWYLCFVARGFCL